MIEALAPLWFTAGAAFLSFVAGIVIGILSEKSIDKHFQRRYVEGGTLPEVTTPPPMPPVVEPRLPHLVNGRDTVRRILRDEFAMNAMVIMWDAYDKGYCGVIDPDTFDNATLAEGAYQIADAMLAERDKANK